MASGLLSSLRSMYGKLQDAVRGSGDDSNKIKSIEEDLKWLSRTLERIEAVQQDAEEREIRDRSVQLWLRELRGVAHEAEDVLDEYHYEVLKSMVENRSVTTEAESSHIGSKRKTEEMFTQLPLVSSSSRVAKILIPDGMVDKIKQIRERFEEISKARDDLHLREGDGERRILGPQNRPPTSSHIDEKGLFGREKEKEHIISLINPVNGHDFMVLPIVGKGGLGKTTLAQLVYNDSEVNRLFDKKAWVSVSEDFDLVRLTKAIIESITKVTCSFSELTMLQDVLKEKLADIRLFLVLDDVWNEKNDLWESFKKVFNGAKTVKLLVTTRNYSVAKIMQTIAPFELGLLPEDKCWMIFENRAFDNKEINKHENLVQIGRDIVKKCNGMPLVVKVLGGLLQYETNYEKWREVLESEIWVIDEKNEIVSALSLSYHYMPLQLRSCFLYLSVFPKDKKLDKDLVVRQWTAHGYINPRLNKTLEDIGCEYFEELRCRSLIDYINDEYYVLHDLIHDLAASINERMYPTLNNDKPWDSSFPVYHLCINMENRVPKYITTNNHKSVRTLLCNGFGGPEIDNAISFSMVCLRVLYLYLDYTCTKFPDGIGILKHLRYLKIYGINLEKLPESLCVLYNLQTLELDCYSLLELPIDIENLINLRHLLISSGKIKQLPESICYLYNLQTLELSNCHNLKELPSRMEQLTSLHELSVSQFSGINIPSGFCNLTNLRTIRGTLNVRGDKLHTGLGELKFLNKLGGSLSIQRLENITSVEYAKEASLKSKSNLKCLQLDFIHLGYACRDPYLLIPDLYLLIQDSTGSFKKYNEIQESVLESLQPHGNIEDLTIRHYSGTKYPSWLGDHSCFPNLTCLYLKSCSKMNFLPSLKFLVLKRLYLDDMPEWNEWTGVLDDDLPCLKTLSIFRCPNLRNIPTIPNNMQNLHITKCGLNEIRLPLSFTMKDMKISNCEELTAIIGLNYQKSLTRLTLDSCPLLENPVGGFLQSITAKIKIYNCPRLHITAFKNTCLYKRDDTTDSNSSLYHCPGVTSVLVCAKEVLANPFLEHPKFKKCVALDLPLLEKLSAPILGENFIFVKHMCIIGCPKLRHWTCDIPEMLEFLQVSCCDELITIPALDKNVSLLEIRVSNCPKLSAIRAQRCLFSLRTLFVKDCQELREMPCEMRRPQTVEISNCPGLKDWCQLNGITMNKDGEGSSSMIHCFLSDTEGDVDTSLHL